MLETPEEGLGAGGLGAGGLGAGGLGIGGGLGLGIGRTPLPPFCFLVIFLDLFTILLLMQDL
jgi:hypothetical protein